MRAWTLLEAMRGRHALHLLCYGDRVISLKAVLQKVHRYGRMDIVALFVTRSYLFPPDESFLEIFEGTGSVTTDEEIYTSEQGFVNIGEAAVLLSYRHATRDDDDLLIWSLLIGDMEIVDPAEMWKRQAGKTSESAL